MLEAVPTSGSTNLTADGGAVVELKRKVRSLSYCLFF